MALNDPLTLLYDGAMVHGGVCSFMSLNQCCESSQCRWCEGVQQAGICLLENDKSTNICDNYGGYYPGNVCLALNLVDRSSESMEMIGVVVAISVLSACMVLVILVILAASNAITYISLGVIDEEKFSYKSFKAKREIMAQLGQESTETTTYVPLDREMTAHLKSHGIELQDMDHEAMMTAARVRAAIEKREPCEDLLMRCVSESASGQSDDDREEM